MNVICKLKSVNPYLPNTPIRVNAPSIVEGATLRLVYKEGGMKECIVVCDKEGNIVNKTLIEFVTGKSNLKTADNNPFNVDNNNLVLK